MRVAALAGPVHAARTSHMPEWLPGNAPALPEPNQPALDRTRLAYERTLLAWVRTATGLITFGFSIYKFFQLQHDSGVAAASRRLIGAREFAILAICMGLAAL